MSRIYALYKGDKWLTDGTKYQLARYLNVKMRTIDFYMSSTYAKRGSGRNRKRVIFLYEED